ncbi:MAG: sigma-70 family RNA polymerase sigma factor [Phycisphaerae bacterium]|nr:sigma-70 family RNA polymerase sigma factor [Phycisphaerae bacterium]
MYRSDQELVQACLAGEAGAWDVLVERYGRLVYSIPTRLGLGESDADDVFQSVMSIVLRYLPSLRDEARLSAWLIRTTYRESWRQAKEAKRRRGQALDDSWADSGTPTDTQVVRLERQQQVRQAMDQLDERCARLIRAFFFDTTTASYEEIAAELGMPVGSVGPTRARCFKKLERLLSDI